MRNSALLLVMAQVALPAVAAKRVTVEQLEKVVASVHGKSDAKATLDLSYLELSERLSTVRLSRWEAELPGPESRRALLLLADMSVFLNAPTSEIPATAPPDLIAQRRIIAQTVEYATKTINRLPNFFATRDTIHFEDSPPRQADLGQNPTGNFLPYQPIHPVSRSSVTVLYRDGYEVVDSGAAKGKTSEAAAQGLITSGVFGPILGVVLMDAVGGKLAWSHWEQSVIGPVAVFRYAIPADKSHYQVEFCCAPDHGGSAVFRQYSGYRGEMAVDPTNGTIIRLTLQADLKRADGIVRADVLVEYGPVEIGGKTYICPVKSISISVAPMFASSTSYLRSQSFGPASAQIDQNRNAPLQTYMNEVVFEQYHVFRAEARILAEDNSSVFGNHAVAESERASDANKPDVGARQYEDSTVTNPQRTTPAGSNARVAPVVSAAVLTPSPTPMPEPAIPEISTTDLSEIPDKATNPKPASDRAFTLRVTAHLVDVGIVALDKRGKPVTDLRIGDFEIFDNGRKQTVRYFSRAAAESSEMIAQVPGQPGHEPEQPVYSNQDADPTHPKLGTEATEHSITILLIDSSNLAWSDLTNVREQVLMFLQKLPASEQVGLYLQTTRGFQVLVEETADHDVLESKLRQWMPRAQDLARAQETEQRNREKFDEVLHPSDLALVNGNAPSPFTSTMVDPQLRDWGSDPSRDAMLILVGVARHLAAIPGHKNLVWVASDNVLANWTDTAASGEKSGKHIDSFALRAQEAMNDAHVSVYPLDASQLETMATDSSLQNSSVELSPSVTLPPGVTHHQGGVAGPGLGRSAAEMQQDMRPVQSVIREMAEATGGRVFRRSGNIAANLNSVVQDGRAAYLLGFTPDVSADDQYHQLTINLTTRRGITLRFRKGYQYAKEPATLRDRFRQAIWQLLDLREITVSARPTAASNGSALKLNIAASDLDLTQEGELWTDKLDIFLVQRDDSRLMASIRGQTLVLRLKPDTYQRLLYDGIPFDQFVQTAHEAGSLRIVVVDENSGRMGSVTLPSTTLVPPKS